MSIAYTGPILYPIANYSEDKKPYNILTQSTVLDSTFDFQTSRVTWTTETATYYPDIIYVTQDMYTRWIEEYARDFKKDKVLNEEQKPVELEVKEM